jgi:hypothetical protein
MRIIWCWRCQMDIPMLDDFEFERIQTVYLACAKSPKGSIESTFKPVVDVYEAITGFKDMHPNAIMHHRLSMYGPPCSRCGKPLRTARARVCAVCWNPVITSTS